MAPTIAITFRIVLLFLLPLFCRSFVFPNTNRASTRLLASANDDDKMEDSITMLEELHYRAAKFRLEEEHVQRLIKKKPIKLPYLEARKWVQSNLGAATKEEFNDLVANGNMRSPYLSKNPKVYYTKTGDWISWDHFLTGYFEEQKTGITITPSTGKFD